MGEAGDDQVFVGSARPDAQPKKGIIPKMKDAAEKGKAKAKDLGNKVVDAGTKAKEKLRSSPVVDKVWDRVSNRLKQNTGEIVERKWMDAYQRTVNALDEGKRKQLVKKLKPVAVGVAKTFRVGSVVVDVVLAGGGVASAGLGAAEVIHPIFVGRTAGQLANRLRDNKYVPQGIINELDHADWSTANDLRKSGVKNIIAGGVGMGLSRARIGHVASGMLADVAGMGGEKVAQVTNKILRGKPRTETATA